MSTDADTIPLSVSYTDVVEAYSRIKEYVNRTPVLTSTTLDNLTTLNPFIIPPVHLLFKCENFQKVGAFKFRGATNAVLKLSPSQLSKGVVTHSSGNHAQALAKAAADKGTTAYIVMPSNSPVIKKNAVKGYGAVLTECEPTLKAREDTAERIHKETGATFIHPFNNTSVIAGQGTVMLELIEQAKEMGTPLDAVIVPVGGGGLLSGCSIAAKGMDPSIRVFAAEPLNADDSKRSLESGTIIPSEDPKTVADGLLTSLGDLTFPIIQRNVEKIFTVTEEEIIRAMKLVWERMKIIIEPSSAVCAAVVLFNEEFRYLEPPLKNVGVVFSGGNVDFSKAFELFQSV